MAYAGDLKSLSFVGSSPTFPTMANMLFNIDEGDVKILEAVQESYPNKTLDELISSAIALLGVVNFLHENHSQTINDPLYKKFDELQ